MNVLAIGANPDDIEVGMGATIAKHTDSGDTVTMVMTTVFPTNEDAARWEEARDAADILGAELHMLPLESDEIECNRELVSQFDTLIQKYDPDVVYTPWKNDSHQDHRQVTHTTVAAARKNHASVYMYETMLPGGIVADGFNPQMYVDVSQTFDRKRASLRAHGSQLEQHGENWLAGVEGRGQYRGSQIDVEYAEVFQVIKQIGLL